jgi:hypothetical protein
MQKYRLVLERFSFEVGDYKFTAETEEEALNIMWETVKDEKFGIGKRITLYRTEKTSIASRTETEIAYAISNKEIIKLEDEEGA